MINIERNKPPRYMQIALDFAKKINDDHYKEGERVFARSAVASQYNVSSETARRAMCILEDHNIVVAEKGSGIKILSKEKAVTFINQYQSFQSVSDLQQDIIEDLAIFTKLGEEINQKINALVDRVDRFRDSGPFVPYQITVPKNSFVVNKTLAQTNFWQLTEATVIGLKRGEELIFSPGAKVVLYPGDILYFVGYEDCYERVHELLYK